MIRLLLVISFIFSAQYSLAEMNFDGQSQVIPYHQWQVLQDQIPADATDLAHNLDHYQWLPIMEHSPAKSIYAGQIIRLDVHISANEDETILLVIPSSFIPGISAGVVKDGEVLLWQNLLESMRRDKAHYNRSVSMISLPNAGPGDYRILIQGSGVSTRMIAHEAELFLSDDFLLQEYPARMTAIAAYVGVFVTYLVFCSILILYRARISFLFAILFLLGAIVSIFLREGVLFFTFPLDVDWWSRLMLPLAINMTYAGIILYIAADLRGFRWPGLRYSLIVIGWFALLTGLLNLIFPVRQNQTLGAISFIIIDIGFLIAVSMMVLRTIEGRLRDILFAICLSGFCLYTLLRSVTTFYAHNYHIPDDFWYYSVNLASFFILVEYLWVLTREYVSRKTEQTASLTRFDLVSRFSHELRTPLNAVIGLADLLKDAKELNKVKNYGAMIHQAGHNLLELVNDILDFSKLESARSATEYRPFRIDQLINETIYSFLPKVYEKNIFLKALIHPDTPFFLVGDELRLKQIFSNLISNAFKFSHTNSEIIIHVTQGGFTENKTELLCSVSDTGRGIPKDKLDSIFEPFSQVSTEDQTRMGGTGLGLAICKLLVEQMQGEISVQSDEGKGTTFSFSLWLDINPKAPNLREVFSAFQGKKILIISRISPFYTPLKIALTHWGATVTRVDTCSEVPDCSYDLIILETDFTCSESDIPWIEQQASNTPIRIIQLSHNTLEEKIKKTNVKILQMPSPLLSTLAILAESINGEPISLLDTPTKSDGFLQSPHSILLVDDNQVNLLVANKLLQSVHAKSATAQGGKEALERLKDPEQRFSLVLLDCEMPDLDGFEVCRRWRDYEAQHKLDRLPIIALTAHALDHVYEECLAAGMDDVCFKPVGKEALVQVLNKYSSAQPIPQTIATDEGLRVKKNSEAEN